MTPGAVAADAVPQLEDDPELWDDLGDIMRGPWDPERDPDDEPDGPTGLLVDGLPGKPPDGPYPDYDVGRSVVLSGPLGAHHFPGRRMADWSAALAWCEANGWRVHETVRGVRGRWIARVTKKEADDAES